MMRRRRGLRESNGGAARDQAKGGREEEGREGRTMALEVDGAEEAETISVESIEK
jgi:hypothetical protein